MVALHAEQSFVAATDRRQCGDHLQAPILETWAVPTCVGRPR
jgi:hypothetical protein